MTSFEEALAAVRAAASPLPAEDCPSDSALGRVLAADVAAVSDLPPFDNSAMDGYAVRAADLKGAGPGRPVVLRPLSRVAAGARALQTVSPGTAVPVMTGAPLPVGADAVVMRECCRASESAVEVLVEPEDGEHIRRSGEDVRRGQALLAAGATLRAYEVALLCAQGIAAVPVVRRPRAAVVPTGDELGGVVRDSNGPSVAALLGRWGADARALAPVIDDDAELRAAFASALEAADLLVVTGGVSAGDFDRTRPVLESMGMRTVFHKVAMKPGKPVLFGTLGNALVFGLPGNPVAALLCAEEFVRPALEALQGRAGAPPSYHMRGTLTDGYPGAKGRRQYIFCDCVRRDGRFWLTPIRPQGSAMLGMACRARALAVAPAGGRQAAGQELDFRWLK